MDSHRLRRIPESNEEQKSNLNSSEKILPKMHARLLNDTILEEQESNVNNPHVSMVIDDEMKEYSSSSDQEA